MDMLGINWGYLIFQIIFFGIYPLLSIAGLFALRRSHLAGINQVLWALLIVAVPVFGAWAFLILKPGEKTQS